MIPDTFSLTLTTMAFGHSGLRWFEACPCRPASRGLPSSLVQQGCFRCPSGPPFRAIVAHGRRRNERIPGRCRVRAPGDLLGSFQHAVNPGEVHVAE